MKREDISKIFGEATDEQIDKLLALNSSEVEKIKTKLEQERDGYKQQLDTATESLKAFDGVDVADLRNQITTLTSNLSEQAEKHKKEIAQRDQSDWLNKKLDEYGVNSPYARRQLTSDCMSEESGLKWKDGAFYGFDDFMKSAKEQDNTLYLTAEEKALEQKKENAPQFTGSLTSNKQTANYTPPKIF